MPGGSGSGRYPGSRRGDHPAYPSSSDRTVNKYDGGSGSKSGSSDTMVSASEEGSVPWPLIDTVQSWLASRLAAQEPVTMSDLILEFEDMDLDVAFLIMSHFEDSLLTTSSLLPAASVTTRTTTTTTTSTSTTMERTTTQHQTTTTILSIADSPSSDTMRTSTIGTRRRRRRSLKSSIRRMHSSSSRWRSGERPSSDKSESDNNDDSSEGSVECIPLKSLPPASMMNPLTKLTRMVEEEIWDPDAYLDVWSPRIKAAFLAKSVPKDARALAVLVTRLNEREEALQRARAERRRERRRSRGSLSSSEGSSTQDRRMVIGGSRRHSRDSSRGSHDSSGSVDAGSIADLAKSMSEQTMEQASIGGVWDGSSSSDFGPTSVMTSRVKRVLSMDSEDGIAGAVAAEGFDEDRVQTPPTSRRLSGTHDYSRASLGTPESSPIGSVGGSTTSAGSGKDGHSSAIGTGGRRGVSSSSSSSSSASSLTGNDSKSSHRSDLMRTPLDSTEISVTTITGTTITVDSSKSAKYLSQKRAKRRREQRKRKRRSVAAAGGHDFEDTMSTPIEGSMSGTYSEGERRGSIQDLAKIRKMELQNQSQSFQGQGSAPTASSIMLKSKRSLKSVPVLTGAARMSPKLVDVDMIGAYTSDPSSEPGSARASSEDAKNVSGDDDDELPGGDAAALDRGRSGSAGGSGPRVTPHVGPTPAKTTLVVLSPRGEPILGTAVSPALFGSSPELLGLSGAPPTGSGSLSSDGKMKVPEMSVQGHSSPLPTEFGLESSSNQDENSPVGSDGGSSGGHTSGDGDESSSDGILGRTEQFGRFKVGPTTAMETPTEDDDSFEIGRSSAMVPVNEAGEMILVDENGSPIVVKRRRSSFFGDKIPSDIAALAAEGSSRQSTPSLVLGNTDSGTLGGDLHSRSQSKLSDASSVGSSASALSSLGPRTKEPTRIRANRKAFSEMKFANWFEREKYRYVLAVMETVELSLQYRVIFPQPIAEMIIMGGVILVPGCYSFTGLLFPSESLVRTHEDLFAEFAQIEQGYLDVVHKVRNGIPFDRKKPKLRFPLPPPPPPSASTAAHGRGASMDEVSLDSEIGGGSSGVMIDDDDCEDDTKSLLQKKIDRLNQITIEERLKCIDPENNTASLWLDEDGSVCGFRCVWIQTVRGRMILDQKYTVMNGCWSLRGDLEVLFERNIVNTQSGKPAGSRRGSIVPSVSRRTSASIAILGPTPTALKSSSEASGDKLVGYIDITEKQLIGNWSMVVKNDRPLSKDHTLMGAQTKIRRGSMSGMIDFGSTSAIAKVIYQYGRHSDEYFYSGNVYMTEDPLVDFSWYRQCVGDFNFYISDCESFYLSHNIPEMHQYIVDPMALPLSPPPGHLGATLSGLSGISSVPSVTGGGTPNSDQGGGTGVSPVAAAAIEALSLSPGALAEANSDSSRDSKRGAISLDRSLLLSAGSPNGHTRLGAASSEHSLDMGSDYAVTPVAGTDDDDLTLSTSARRRKKKRKKDGSRGGGSSVSCTDDDDEQPHPKEEEAEVKRIHVLRFKYSELEVNDSLSLIIRFQASNRLSVCVKDLSQYFGYISFDELQEVGFGRWNESGIVTFEDIWMFDYKTRINFRGCTEGKKLIGRLILEYDPSFSIIHLYRQPSENTIIPETQLRVLHSLEMNQMTVDDVLEAEARESAEEGGRGKSGGVEATPPPYILAQMLDGEDPSSGAGSGGSGRGDEAQSEEDDVLMMDTMEIDIVDEDDDVVDEFDRALEEEFSGSHEEDEEEEDTVQAPPKDPEREEELRQRKQAEQSRMEEEDWGRLEEEQKEDDSEDHRYSELGSELSELEAAEREEHSSDDDFASFLDISHPSPKENNSDTNFDLLHNQLMSHEAEQFDFGADDEYEGPPPAGDSSDEEVAQLMAGSPMMSEMAGLSGMPVKKRILSPRSKDGQPPSQGSAVEILSLVGEQDEDDSKMAAMFEDDRDENSTEDDESDASITSSSDFDDEDDEDEEEDDYDGNEEEEVGVFIQLLIVSSVLDE